MIENVQVVNGVYIYITCIYRYNNSYKSWNIRLTHRALAAVDNTVHVLIYACDDMTNNI